MSKEKKQLSPGEEQHRILSKLIHRANLKSEEKIMMHIARLREEMTSRHDRLCDRCFSAERAINLLTEKFIEICIEENKKIK